VGAGVAYADTVTLDQYRVRLADARSLIDRSRTAGTADRVRLLAQARDLLRQTTTLRVGDETIAIDDAAVADLAGVPDGASRAIAILDTYISDALRGRRIDPAVADQRLREIVGPSASGGGGANPFAVLADAFLGWLNGLFSGLRGSAPDLSSLVWLVVAVGAALVLFIVATLGRGLRERVRTEIVIADTGTCVREDPTARLRLADQALARGHAREAIRELYLYAIAALAAREAFRYDPALTDRELLVRAAGIPHADALGDLVALYERAWFGLREPATAEAERARSLALRAAA